jgi:RNA polymerase sigma factor (sigma-70 family)
MPRPKPSPLLQYIRNLNVEPAAGQSTDCQLLEKFAGSRDETAFAALVQRHGPMVRSVCLRVLHVEQDAEDAFQATFLVLARKAGALRGENAVGPWLYEVAYRVARKAKTAAARRTARERRARGATPHASISAADWHELRAVLDEEMNRLPRKYRIPLVLCYLGGKTNQEAAGELGWTKGTVSGRLARARDLLRARLRRRGLTLSSAALSAALAPESLSPSLPALGASAAIKVAVRLAAGQEARVSACAAALAKAVLREMFWDRLKGAAAWLLVLAVVGPAAGVLCYRALAGAPSQAKHGGAAAVARPEPPALVKKEASAPPPADEGAKPKPEVVKMAEEPKPGVVWREQATLQFKGWIESLALSPDGKMVAAVGMPSGRMDGVCDVTLWDASTRAKRAALSGRARAKQMKPAPAILFSPDGKTLALIGRSDLALWDWATDKVRSADRTGKIMRVPPGPPVEVQDCEPICFAGDGMTLAARGSDGKVRVYDAATGKLRGALPTEQQGVCAAALSPDGTTLTTVDDPTGYGPLGAAKPSHFTVTRWDVATGKALEKHQFETGDGKKDGFLVVESPAVVVSPDGKRVARCSPDGTIRVWDVTTGQLQAAVRPKQWVGPAAVALSPDGKTLAAVSATMSGCPVTVWDLTTRQEQGALKGPQDFSSVTALTFSADGRTLAVGDNVGTVKVWAASAPSVGQGPASAPAASGPKGP